MLFRIHLFSVTLVLYILAMILPVRRSSHPSRDKTRKKISLRDARLRASREPQATLPSLRLRIEINRTKTCNSNTIVVEQPLSCICTSSHFLLHPILELNSFLRVPLPCLQRVPSKREQLVRHESAYFERRGEEIGIERPTT